MTSRAPSAVADAIAPKTCSMCPSKATGPISVSGSSGSPSRIVTRPRGEPLERTRRGPSPARTAASRPCRSGRSRRRCPRRRRWRRPRGRRPRRRCSGDLPPSSSVTRARWSAAPFITALPVAVPPVNATLSTPGCATSGAPASPPKPVTTLKTPGGKPASSTSAANSSVEAGACSAGLTTTRAARRQRRRGLPAHQQHGRVPRRDRGHDADAARAACRRRSCRGPPAASRRRPCRPRPRSSGSSRPARAAGPPSRGSACRCRSSRRRAIREALLSDQLREPAQQPRAGDWRSSRPMTRTRHVRRGRPRPHPRRRHAGSSPTAVAVYGLTLSKVAPERASTHSPPMSIRYDFTRVANTLIRAASTTSTILRIA